MTWTTRSSQLPKRKKQYYFFFFLDSLCSYARAGVCVCVVDMRVWYVVCDAVYLLTKHLLTEHTNQQRNIRSPFIFSNQMPRDILAPLSLSIFLSWPLCLSSLSHSVVRLFYLLFSIAKYIHTLCIIQQFTLQYDISCTHRTSTMHIWFVTQQPIAIGQKTAIKLLGLTIGWFCGEIERDREVFLSLLLSPLDSFYAKVANLCAMLERCAHTHTQICL